MDQVKHQGDYYDDYPGHWKLEEHGREYALIKYIETLESENKKLREQVKKLLK